MPFAIRSYSKLCFAFLAVSACTKTIPLTTKTAAVVTTPPVASPADGTNDKPAPSLASLNSQAYTPAPGDLSPEGFNWTHRDLGLVYAGAVYEEGLSGKWREDVLRQKQPALSAYLASIRAISRKSFDTWPAAHRTAFLIDAYHAHLLKLMLDQNFMGLDDKLLEKPGTFDLFGERRSFQDFVEKELRARYRDPRIFFSLVCFASTCPEWRNSTYNAKNLEAMLDASTARFFRNPAKNHLDIAAKTFTLSPIVFRNKQLVGQQPLSAYIAGYLESDPANTEAVSLLRAGKLTLK